MTIAAVRLNHAVLFVSDLERSLRFWTGAFGMEIVTREPQANAAFLRLSRSGNHHDRRIPGVVGKLAAPESSPTALHRTALGETPAQAACNVDEDGRRHDFRHAVSPCRCCSA